jgi:hypothetical protein
MGANVASKVLFLDHRRPSVLAGIVQRAKTVLEADPRFFEGANAPKRVSNGRILEPSMPSSPENFIHSTFVPKEGGRRKFFSVKVAGDFSEGGWLCGFRFFGLGEGEVGFASFPGFGDFSEDACDESQE